MSNPISFYKNELEIHLNEVRSLQKQLVFLSTLRLMVFLLTVGAIYVALPNWKMSAILGILGTSIFIWLLSRYTDKKANRELHKALVSINEDELKIASGDYLGRKSGAQFQDPKHFYSLDIDLFGIGSFFQYLNRTRSSEGQTRLANALKANSISNIKERQEAIKELSQKPKWTQHFTATASLIKTETPAPVIIDWLKDHKAFIPKYMKGAIWLFSAISVGLLTLSIMEILDISFFGYWLFLGLAITGKFLKRINSLAANSDKAKEHL